MDKAAKVSTPRLYELTYLVPGTASEAELNQVKTDVEALFKKYSVKVEQNDDWGRRALAYVITHEGKKQHDAFYTYFVLSMTPEGVPAFDHDINLHAKIMRHLLTVADKKKMKAAAPQPAVPATEK